MRRICLANALMATVLLATCAGAPDPLDAVAEGYVRAALMLAQHDPDLVEAWRGDPSWRPGPRRPVAEIARMVEDLSRRVVASIPRNALLAEHARARYLISQLRGLLFAVQRMLGRPATVDDQFSGEFGIGVPALDRDAVGAVHARIDEILPGQAPLKDRVAVFRASATVPRGRRQAVIEAALQACRRATTAAVDLPPDESVRILFRSDMPWDGYARYAGAYHTDLEINDHGALDVSRAFRLACHEGYPGHHVQYVLLDRVVAGGHADELLLTPAFGRHLLLAEGAAEVAADLALSTEGRAALYRDALFPAAGLAPDRIHERVELEGLLTDLLPVVTDVARQYLASTITSEAAIDRLANDALVTSPAATLASIERRRARALVYGEGRRAVYAGMPTKDLNGLRAMFPGRSALE